MKAIIVKVLGAGLIATVMSIAAPASAKRLAPAEVGGSAPVVPIPRAKLLATIPF
jgi:hypothetical protein